MPRKTTRRKAKIEARANWHRNMFNPRMDKPEGLCRWFLMCSNPATTTVAHPILGDVPACERCARFAR